MPIIPLVLVFFGLEIYILIKVWGAYGFVNTFFALLACTILGAGLARTQGRFIITKLQRSVANREMPSDQVLHGMLIFIGALFFILPGFLSDVVALLLILPGIRHLMVLYMKNRFQEQIRAGRFRFASFAGSWGFSTGTRTSDPQAEAVPPADGWARDVSPKTIDVTPISSESHEKDENNSDS